MYGSINASRTFRRVYPFKSQTSQRSHCKCHGCQKEKKKYNYIYLFHDEKQGFHLIHMHHLQFISPASMIRGHEIALKCRTLVWPDYHIKSNRYRGN